MKSKSTLTTARIKKVNILKMSGYVSKKESIDSMCKLIKHKISLPKLKHLEDKPQIIPKVKH